VGCTIIKKALIYWINLFTLVKRFYMQRLYIWPTTTTLEVNFSPEENIFLLHGASSPEDVRAMYYPGID
jgi:hypothetical protein